MTRSKSKTVGRVIRIEWNPDTNGVVLALELTDDAFKSRVLHRREYEDLITIVGRNVILEE